MNATEPAEQPEGEPAGGAGKPSGVLSGSSAGGAGKPSGVLSGGPDGGAGKPSGVLSGNTVPAAPDIAELRKEIDWLDAEILRLVKRRTEVSRTIGATRMASGGTRIVVNREMDVLARYRELGEEGRQLAMVLLNLGRGRLGR